MCPSDGPATILLLIDVPADVETVLLDAELHERARSIGRSEQQLASGIYKVKFRRGSRTAESVLMLAADATVQTVGLPEELSGTTRSQDPAAVEHHRRVLQAAHDTSLAIHGALGHGSQLMVFVGADSATEEVRPRRLALYRGKTRLWDYAETQAPPPNPLPWWGANLALSPGPYTLRLGGGHDGSLEQTVFLPRGWQLQVFLRWGAGASTRRPGATSSDATAWPSPRRRGSVLAGSAAILLARAGMGFDPTSGALELAETVRASMGPSRVRFAQSLDQRLLERWLDAKVGNPMLGLFAVHAMRIAAERNPDAMRDREGLIGSVLDRMTCWIGRHPDVDALRLHYEKLPVADFDSDVLPMLMASYELLRDRVLERDAANPKRSAYERAAGALWGNGPWLMWREKALTASKRTAATEDSSSAALKSVVEAVSSPDAVQRLERESLSNVDSAIVALLAGSSKAASRRPGERRASAERTVQLQAAPGSHGASSPGGVPASGTESRGRSVAYAIPSRRQIATQLGLPQSLVDDRLAVLHGLVGGAAAPVSKGMAHPLRVDLEPLAVKEGVDPQRPTDRIYMTSAGIERLRAEVRRIDNIDLADCAAAIASAKALSGFSDSAEYVAAKEKEAVLLGRSATLKGMLNRAHEIDIGNVRMDAVTVGTRVRIWLPGGEEKTYTLLGPTDVDEAHDIVDYGAPIGRALLGLKVGDTVELPTSTGIQSAKVLAIDAARLEDE